MTTLHHIAAGIAGILGASGVALGAFGAHALKGVLDGPKTALWQTASNYHLLHAVALAALAALIAVQQPERPMVAKMAVITLSVGTALFSGSLYGLALGAPKIVGAVTPLGGVCLIIGWLMMAALGLGSLGRT